MKYADAQKMADDLEDFAAFIRENGPKIPGDIYIGSSYNTLYDKDGLTAKEQAKIVAKVLAKGALVEKRHSAYDLDLIRYFGKIKLVFSINREKFCTRKVVGTKQHEERVVAAYTEDIVEWECNDPVLG